MYEIGLTGYDLLGSRKSAGRHRHLGLDETLEYAPDLVRKDLRGALLYHDAMEDDARFTLAVVRTAQARWPDAAVAVTRVRATGPLRDGERVTGARVEDGLTGTDLRRPRGRGPRRDRRLGRAAGPPVRGRLVLRPAGARRAPRHPPRPDPGEGRHDAADPGPHRVPRPVAATLDHRHDRQAAPRARWTASPPRAEDVDEILGTLNGALDLELTRDDLVGTYAGLRPLIAPSDASSTVTDLPGAPGERGGARPRPGERRQVHDLPGDGPRRGGRGARATPPALARAATRQLPIHGAAPARGARRARSAPRRRRGARRRTRRRPSSIATARTLRRSSRSAASTTSSGRSSPASRSSRRRSPGAWSARWRSRSTTCSPAGCASPTCCRDRGEAIAPRVADDRRARPGLGRGTPRDGGCGVPRRRPARVRHPGRLTVATVAQGRHGWRVHAPARRSCRDRKIGCRHGCGLWLDCAPARPSRACSHSIARSTLGLLRNAPRTLEDPGKRRRQLEEIGTWPTRP